MDNKRLGTVYTASIDQLARNALNVFIRLREGKKAHFLEPFWNLSAPYLGGGVSATLSVAPSFPRVNYKETKQHRKKKHRCWHGHGATGKVESFIAFKYRACFSLFTMGQIPWQFPVPESMWFFPSLTWHDRTIFPPDHCELTHTFSLVVNKVS